MTDNNLSLSTSTGSSGPLLGMSQEMQIDAVPNDGQPLDTLSPSDQQPEAAPPPSYPSLESPTISLATYLSAINNPKLKLQTSLVEANLSNADLAKWLHGAMAANASAQGVNYDTTNTLDEEMQQLYDEQLAAIAEMNQAIEMFNQAVLHDKQALTGTMRNIAQDINDYETGTISGGELKQDLNSDKEQVGAFKSEVKGQIGTMHTAINQYNAFVAYYNAQAAVYNAQLQELGISYQMDYMESLSLPLFPPIAEVAVPLPPPNTDELMAQMTNPPVSQDAIDTYAVIATQSLMLSSRDSAHLARLLEALSSQLPIGISLIHNRHYYLAGSESKTGISFVIKNLNQKIVQVMHARELIENKLKNFGIPFSSELFYQLVMVHLRVMAQSGLWGFQETFRQLSHEPKNQSRLVEIINGVSNAVALKRAIKASHVGSLIENAVKGHPAIERLPLKSRQRVVDFLQAVTKLNVLHAAMKQLEMALDVRGLAEQLFAQGVRQAGLEYDRTPETFNNALQNPLYITSLMDTAIDTLISKHFAEPVATVIVGNAFEAVLTLHPFSSFEDFRSSLTSRLLLSGIGSSLLASQLAEEVEARLRLLMPFSPEVDLMVGAKFQLLDAHQQLFDNEGKYERALSAESQEYKAPLRASIQRHVFKGAVLSFPQLQRAISSDLITAGASKESADRVASAYMTTIEEDPILSQVTELTPARVEKLQNDLQLELELRAVNPAASRLVSMAVMQGLAGAPVAIRDEELAQAIVRGIDVSAGTDGGISGQQLRKLGVDEAHFGTAIQTARVNSLSAEKAFQFAIRDFLRNIAMLAPAVADRVSEQISLRGVVDIPLLTQRLATALKGEGRSPNEAKLAVKSLLKVPGAYSSDSSFRAVLDAILTSGLGSAEATAIAQAIDTNGLIHSAVLQEQMAKGLQAAGVAEEDLVRILQAIADMPPFSSETLSADLEETLRPKQLPPQFLEGALHKFFAKKGVFEPMAKSLAEEAANLFFATAGEIADEHIYYQTLKAAVATIVASGAHDFDFTYYISESAIENLHLDLGITAFSRAEILQKAIEAELVNLGVGNEEAEIASGVVTSQVLRTPGLFNQGQEQVSQLIANTLSSLDIAHIETSKFMLHSANLNLVLNGPPLGSAEAAKLLDADALKAALLRRVREVATFKKMEQDIEPLLFGSSAGEESVAELYAQQLRAIIEKGDNEMAALIQQQFKQYKSSASDQFLRNFSGPGVTLALSLLEGLQEGAEEEVARSFMERSV